MRLTQRQRRMIAGTATEIFGANTPVALFGSRTDDSTKGGDIDLLISTDLDAETARLPLKPDSPRAVSAPGVGEDLFDDC